MKPVYAPFYWLKLVKNKVFNPFKSSKKYWEKWHINNKNKETKYNQISEFKIQVVNDWIHQYKIKNVIDFGCGDGSILNHISFENYLGVDVSETAIDLCQKKQKKDASIAFITLEKYKGAKAQMTISLDVIYYLVEDLIYKQYLTKLFDSSESYVLIYSTNVNGYNELIPHIKHRQFTDWVKKCKKDFVLINHIKDENQNFEGHEQANKCEFYLYQKLILK